MVKNGVKKSGSSVAAIALRETKLGAFLGEDRRPPRQEDSVEATEKDRFNKDEPKFLGFKAEGVCGMKFMRATER